MRIEALSDLGDDLGLQASKAPRQDQTTGWEWHRKELCVLGHSLASQSGQSAGLSPSRKWSSVMQGELDELGRGLLLPEKTSQSCCRLNQHRGFLGQLIQGLDKLSSLLCGEVGE